MRVSREASSPSYSAEYSIRPVVVTPRASIIVTDSAPVILSATKLLPITDPSHKFALPCADNPIGGNSWRIHVFPLGLEWAFPEAKRSIHVDSLIYRRLNRRRVSQEPGSPCPARLDDRGLWRSGGHSPRRVLLRSVPGPRTHPARCGHCRCTASGPCRRWIRRRCNRQGRTRRSSTAGRRPGRPGTCRRRNPTW